MSLLALLRRDLDLPPSVWDQPALAQDLSELARESLGLSPLALVRDPKLQLSAEQRAALLPLAKRLIQGEPVGRILGRRGFWRHEFALSADTLEPRPDSELLVEHALAHLPATGQQHVLDLGTGTGCLLLSILAERPQAQGWGCDIAPGAIKTAADNAARLGLGQRSHFLNSDWFSALPADLRFDVIVSNPPYIPTGDLSTLAPEVQRYDPARALDGGADGLAAYRLLASQAGAWLKPGGALVLEIGFDQGASVPLLFQAWQPLGLYQDLGGQDRCLVFTLQEN